MRFVALALLLLTPAANAQWVSPIEQMYGPYLAPSIGAEPAIVASNHGVLLVWSEIDPLTNIPELHSGILDFDGRLVSPITILPQYQVDAHAKGPVVATDGETFAVGWLESQGLMRVAAIALDANGAPAAPPRGFGGYYELGTITPPLVWNGSAYQIFGFAFDRDGQPVLPETDMPAVLRYAANGTFVGMKWESHRAGYRCSFGRPNCVWFDADFTVTWEIVRGNRHEQTSRAWPYYTDSTPIVAGDDDEMAIVWSSANGIEGMRVVDGKYHSSFAIPKGLTPATPEGIAFDGERWLVAFERDRDIWGAFVDRDSFNVTPFPIATSGRAESKARVTALKSGRFLVSYSSDVVPRDHRFAGRVVLTEPPKKTRALR